MILRFLLYRVYIVYESSYNTENITKSSSVSPSISASQLFLVHLLKAYYAAEMNATVLIKELLAMTAHDIITKLTVGRAIEKSTTYTLLCAYQARYPLLLPTPPLPLLDTNTAVSNPSISISISVSSTSSSSNSRQIYSAIMRQIPDIMFESRVGVINSAIVADDAMDKLLVLLNRYGDSYFQVCI